MSRYRWRGRGWPGRRWPGCRATDRPAPVRPVSPPIGRRAGAGADREFHVTGPPAAGRRGRADRRAHGREPTRRLRPDARARQGRDRRTCRRHISPRTPSPTSSSRSSPVARWPAWSCRCWPGRSAAGDRRAVGATASALLTWVLILLVPLAVLVALFAGPIVSVLARRRPRRPDGNGRGRHADAAGLRAAAAALRHRHRADRGAAGASPLRLAGARPAAVQRRRDRRLRRLRSRGAVRGHDCRGQHARAADPGDRYDARRRRAVAFAGVTGARATDCDGGRPCTSTARPGAASPGWPRSVS